MSLTKKLKHARDAQRRDEVLARSPRTDPREAHEAEVRAGYHRREIGQLEQAIDDRRRWESELRKLIGEMREGTASRELSAAITKAQEAAMWLREEVEG